MQALKYWAKCLTLDAIIVALFILWKRDGSDGAGNIFLAFIWLTSIFKLLGGLVMNKTNFEKGPKRPTGFSTYDHITEAILFGALAFYGMFVLSVVRVVAHLLMEGARNREPKVKTGGAV